jgi:hypothetical protein
LRDPCECRAHLHRLGLEDLVDPFQRLVVGKVDGLLRIIRIERLAQVSIPSARAVSSASRACSLTAMSAYSAINPSIRARDTIW